MKSAYSATDFGGRLSRYAGAVAIVAILMAGVPAWASSVSLNDNVLTITGEDGVDSIIVTTNGGNVQVTINGTDYAGQPVGSVTTVEVYGLGGDDTIDCSGVPDTINCVVHGGDGDDTVIGATDSDTSGGGTGGGTGGGDDGTTTGGDDGTTDDGTGTTDDGTGTTDDGTGTTDDGTGTTGDGATTSNDDSTSGGDTSNGDTTSGNETVTAAPFRFCGFGAVQASLMSLFGLTLMSLRRRR